MNADPLWAKAVRVRAAALKVDHLDRPLGLESLRPRFSWRLESVERNVRQSAYRILVAGSEAVLQNGQGDLWDSGKVASRQSFGIEYGGKGLQSRQRCWWRVQVWDKAGNVSEFSDASWWEMGLLNPQDWTAQWLAVEDAVAKADREAGLQWIWGASQENTTRKFRLKFQLPAGSHSGELFAVTNDYSPQIERIWLDGKPVTRKESSLLTGHWLSLGALNAGEHLIAVEVGYTPLPAVMEQAVRGMVLFARLDMSNADTLRMGVGSNWKTSLTQDNDWFKPEYEDQAWEKARPVSIDVQPWPALPAMQLRREFSITKKVVRARLYATALGAYEARLNGRRVGDALLTPEISQYAKRVLYRVYDVTSMLQQDVNALGLVVGDGWYASFDGYFAWGPPPRRALAQLEIEFADGSRQIVATGPEWRIAPSPILAAEIRVGEIYDARLEQRGWDSAGFDASKWPQAETAAVPSARLAAHTCAPVRAVQTLKPRTISQPAPGVYVIDFGQNFAGWCRLRAKGIRGSQIELRFAELLAPSGEIDASSMDLPQRTEDKRDVFILRGDDAGETFEPHFTYRGFRYVQVTGLTAAPTVESIEGIVVHSDLETTGQLRIDAPLIEQTWRNTVWTQRSNFVAIPTDCPSREQRGWMGDAAIFWDAAAFNMDVSAFTQRQMDNARDDQAADGAFPMVAPEPRAHGFSVVDGSAPAWGDGGIILPWTAWRHYGDVAVIERNWEAMNRYVQFIQNHNPDSLWKNKRGYDFGDWLALGENSFIDASAAPTTPKDLIGTAYWAYSAALLAQMAEATGRTADATRLHALHARVRQAFNDAFVKPDGTVGNGSQTSYVLALKFGLLSEKMRQSAAERLAADIRSRGSSLTTGIVGTQFILDVLADAGFPSLAFDLLLRNEYPSWGHMIRNGATTIWESWSGELEFGGKNAVKSSQNHYALGAICGFLFRRIAGIDAATPGFETIVIRPMLDPRVRRGGGDYDSILGRISTDWEHTTDGGFTLNATLPPNTTARIHLPTRRNSSIKEGRKAISERSAVRIRQRSDHEAVIEVGSGRYRFEVATPSTMS